MKFIKSYQIFESTDYKLKRELEKCFIYKYTLNEDGSVDCNQYVNLWGKKITAIPFKFNKIDGDFSITGNELAELKNCPKNIIGNFSCSLNKLTSLEYGPEYVDKSYNCSGNQLITLKGCIDMVYGDFYCQNNLLTSLEFCPMQVDGKFDCSDNKLEYIDKPIFIKGNLWCLGMFKTSPEFNGSCKNLIWR